VTDLLSWQFSVGFAAGVLAGGLLVMRAFALAAHEARSGGHRGHTPAGADRRVLPQGGSGTARPAHNREAGL
jgi:hypothetical protein